MTEPSPNTQPASAAPRALWRVMRAFLCLLFDLFGEPGAIAARGVLGRRSRALLLPWLRAGEAFLRRLLFIEALALSPGLRVRPSETRTHASRQGRLVQLDPDKPEDWRVSFRLVPPARRVSRGGGSRRAASSLGLQPALPMVRTQQAPERWRARIAVRSGDTPVRVIVQRAPRDPHDAWPVAERLEAMLRTFNAPQRSARRLARMLLRDERRALRALQPTPAHAADLFGARSFARCDAIVASRRRRRDRQRAPDTS